MHDQAQLSPSIFLDALVRCPQERQFREAAVSWYAIDEPDDARCAWHMSRLAVYHPESLDIGLLGRRLFILRPRLRQMLERRLLRQIPTVENKGAVFFNLGAIVSSGMAVAFCSPEDEQRWRGYLGIPLQFDLSSSWDSDSGPRAVAYLRQALEAPDADTEAIRDLATIEAMRILKQLGRTADIIEVGGQMRRPAPPDALVDFADALCKVGQVEDARVVFREAIEEDKWGYEQGGHASVAALIQLAEIALQDGDEPAAKAHLQAASKIEPCCHTTSSTIRRLVRALVALNEHRTAVSYLHAIAASIPKLSKTINDLLAEYHS